ncbi:unnamed protein product [Pneumocystis jirovecii]|uniref:Uncharacterized protein n=1 Tax=Pneumocystis jirovecii TaxID=42068 RepID=L0PA40_PNEJI|nr:unnamed protein product [Pneumocystis jirovecii]
MRLGKQTPRDIISVFLRPTEELSSFFEVDAFIKEKNCLIKQLYVAVIKHGRDNFNNYKESAYKDYERLGIRLNDDTVSFVFSKLIFLHEFMRNIRQHKEMLGMTLK